MLSENLPPKAHPLDKLLRTDRLPHIWCPGCGIGIALNSFLRAVKKLNLDPKSIVLISGIGCSGRASGYVAFDSFHTTHGRAIPLAMGVKIARPDLKVVVFSGDGDLFAIGGNHIIHAARRNLDLLVICINNFNYGMTGGQLGPTTPFSSYTTTAPYGNIEHPFNLVHLTAAAGASFVARWTVAHPIQLARSIEKALNKHGFSFIEVIAPCVTLYARYNKLGRASQIIKYLKEISVIEKSMDSSKADIKIGSKIFVGEFVDVERPEYVSELYRVIREKSGRKIDSLVR